MLTWTEIREYTYTFRDEIGVVDEWKKSISNENGFIPPANAVAYACKLYEIVKSLIDKDYIIEDCFIQFVDQDGCDFGIIEIVQKQKFSEESFRTWEEKYLKSVRTQDWKDVIEYGEFYMKLKQKNSGVAFKHRKYHITSNSRKTKKNPIPYKLKASNE